MEFRDSFCSWLRFISLFILFHFPAPLRSDSDSKKAAASNGGEPLSEQLLLYDEATRQVDLQPATLEKLSSLQGPLHIITAIGDARIGKSTAFNVIAAMLTTKDKKGRINAVTPLFNVCQSLETCTKGVWIHTFPLHNGGHLVMLDVEGTDLGADMITTQFSLLTSLLSSNVLVFLKESFPKRTGIFLHELARLKERLSEHHNHVLPEQTLSVIIRDPLKPPQDVSLKTYVTRVLADPSYCMEPIAECKLLEKHFPLSLINVYSMPYVSRRHQKSFEWALKDKTYLKTASSLVFDIKSSVDSRVGPEATGSIIAGIIRTFTDTLVHSTSSSTPTPPTQTCDSSPDKCQPAAIEAEETEVETSAIEEVAMEEPADVRPPDGDPKVGRIDVERIIKSPFETIGPGVYSFIMNNILRLKPTPVPDSSPSNEDESGGGESGSGSEDGEECEDGECSSRQRAPQDTLARWGKAIHEFIDDMSDAFDDFYSSVLSE